MAHILVENDPIDKPKQMPPSKKFLLFRKLVKNAKWWSKSSLPNYPSLSLTLLTAKFFPLKMVLKNHDRACQRCDTFSTTYFIYEYYMVSNRPFQRPLCFSNFYCVTSGHLQICHFWLHNSSELQWYYWDSTLQKTHIRLYNADQLGFHLLHSGKVIYFKCSRASALHARPGQVFWSMKVFLSNLDLTDVSWASIMCTVKNWQFCTTKKVQHLFSSSIDSFRTHKGGASYIKISIKAFRAP